MAARPTETRARGLDLAPLVVRRRGGAEQPSSDGVHWLVLRHKEYEPNDISPEACLARAKAICWLSAPPAPPTAPPATGLGASRTGCRIMPCESISRATASGSLLSGSPSGKRRPKPRPARAVAEAREQASERRVDHCVAC